MDKPLTAEDLKAYEEARKTLGKAEGKIIDRIDYIIKTIFKAFKKRLSCWYFYGAAEGEVGEIAMDDFDVRPTMEPYHDMLIMLEYKEGKKMKKGEWGLQDGFPTRWLTEDFEEELQQGIAEYKAHKEEEKAKEKEKQEVKEKEKQELIESAKGKLSAKERRALGIK